MEPWPSRGEPGSDSAQPHHAAPAPPTPQYLWMRVEYLNETLGQEWHRMVAAEAQRQTAEGEAGEAAAAALAQDAAQLHQAEVEHGRGGGIGNGGSGSSSNGSSSSNSSLGHSAEQQQQQQQPVAAAVAAGSSGGGACETAVYAPGAPLTGTATGGPGSIPWAAEQHVHEVTTTGAAISLALLLQQRSEQGERRSGEPDSSSSSGSSANGSAGGRGASLSLVDDEARAHSTAALSALAYLEPCAHGLDELIVFDAIRRKFGIAPRVEGRILRCPSC